MMKFPIPLISGRLIRRYKRFLSDVELESGLQVVAHCPNPGSMLGLADPGNQVWLAPVDSPTRKLKYSWELVDCNGNLVGINTGHANTIVAEAITQGLVSELSGYPKLRREVRYGRNSRIDILLEAPDRPPCYVEVKNVTLKRKRELAEFPDAVTKRGAKHLEELSREVESGARAVNFYLAQRGDCSRFEIAADIDPEYARAYESARGRGVEVICYGCQVTPKSVQLGHPIKLGP